MKFTNISAWLYTLVAAIFQSFWGITLKKCEFGLLGKAILTLRFFNYRFLELLLPVLLYFVLGLVIVIAISKAYKLLPMSIVYAFWMGLTILFQSLIDLLYFGETFSNAQFFFIGIILIGIIGMKITTQNKENKFWVEQIETIDEEVIEEA